MEIIKLNLIPSGVNPTCHCSQYDNGRVIRIDLFDGLTPYVLQSGDTVTLNVRKPDNTIVTASLTATQGNTYVNLETTEQICACVGYNLCDLTITNGNKVIGTLNFIMQIERDVLADGIPSQSVIEDLDAMVQEAVGDNFYNKTETDALLNAKANKSTTYTKTETDTALALKADKATTYTKTETDTLLNAKANSSDVYAKSQVDTALTLKADIAEVEKIAVDEIGTNLVDPDLISSGYMIGGGGAPDPYAPYDLSDFIEIEEGETYSVGVYNLYYNLFTTRTIYCFYDENKAKVGNVVNIDNTSGLLATAPTGAKYIRISGHTHYDNDIYTLMCAKSESILQTFVPYSIKKVIVADIPELDKLEPLIDTVVMKTGKNLYDSSKSVEGFLEYTGLIVASPSGTRYSTSDLIPVKPNTDYYIACFNSYFQLITNARIIGACYNQSGYIIPNTYTNTDRVSNIVINSGNNPFIRVSTRAELEGNHLIVSEGSMPTMFVDYDGGKYTELYIEQNKMPEKPTLYNKKWAVCGDSFTDGGGTGTVLSNGIYKGRAFTYPWIIGNKNKMEIVKFFNGGQTLAYPSDETFHNSLTDPNADNYYQNIPADVDYITFYLGINDEHHATGGGDGEDPTGVIPLGTIDDNTTSTYYGAWNVVLTWLITNRPNAHIGMIVTNGLSIVGYRTAQIEIARKYGIPFIDLNGDDRTPAMLRTVNENIPATIKQALITKWAVDPTGESGSVNTHPNDAAQLFESTFIENFLRSI